MVTTKQPLEAVEAAYDRYLAAAKEIAALDAANNALEWDMETGMPKAGNDSRAEVMAGIAGFSHEKATSQAYGDDLARLVEAADAGQLDEKRATIVRKAWRAYDRDRKLPREMVQRHTELYAGAHHVWAAAKDANDWPAFLPHLVRIVDAKREEAAAVGYTASPYDALIDEYEPGMTTAQAEAMLGGLTGRLSALVQRIAAKAAPSAWDGRIPARLGLQKRYNRLVARALGYDFGAGRLDESAHPFTAKLHPGDVRITTRYDKGDLLYGLMSTIHEVGHGLYDQGIPGEHYGTPCGDAPSLGIHESQSRLWENMVARSLPFSRFLCERMRQIGIEPPRPEDLYRALNKVEPSFIRTEADEISYNLHICLRFEIERALIEGELAVADVPEAWDAKMRKYLGITPPDAARGALQDVHWSGGAFGYFPTYTLGNLYAAQLYAKAKADIPNLEQGFERGDFGRLLAWLRKNVHAHGGFMEAHEIVHQASGVAPDPYFFLTHVDRKAKELYGL